MDPEYLNNLTPSKRCGQICLRIIACWRRSIVLQRCQLCQGKQGYLIYVLESDGNNLIHGYEVKVAKQRPLTKEIPASRGASPSQSTTNIEVGCRSPLGRVNEQMLQNGREVIP